MMWLFSSNKKAKLSKEKKNSGNRTKEEDEQDTDSYGKGDVKRTQRNITEKIQHVNCCVVVYYHHQNICKIIEWAVSSCTSVISRDQTKLVWIKLIY